MGKSKRKSNPEQKTNSKQIERLQTSHAEFGSELDINASKYYEGKAESIARRGNKN